MPCSLLQSAQSVAVPSNAVGCVYTCHANHTATHCNTLQHTVTHCNTLREIQDSFVPLCIYYRVARNSPKFLAELQCVAVCCSMLQCGAACCSADPSHYRVTYKSLTSVAVCCSVLQCVAACCSVSQCVAVWCSMLQCRSQSRQSCVQKPHIRCSLLQYAAMCGSVLQRVAITIQVTTKRRQRALHPL